MTRLFIAGFGSGITLTLWFASLWGQQTCIGLSFSAGVLSATLIFTVAGLTLCWVCREKTEHSQPLDAPPGGSPYST